MFGNSQRKRRLDVRVAVGVLLAAAFLMTASGASGLRGPRRTTE